MSIANQYNLFFGISNLPGFTPKPYIATPVINGDSVNYEIASFLQSNGLECIQAIKDEINSFNYNYAFNDYNVWGYNDSESVEIRNNPPSPPIAVFNTGGKEVKIPLSVFLQILEEWKNFINSIPTPHWLDNR